MNEEHFHSVEYCNQTNSLLIEDERISHNERRILWVVLLTALMMIAEVIAGYLTGSMALLADGYHMASHAGALGIAYLVYRLTKSEKIRKNLTFGTGKLLPLGGYSSAIGLGIIAVWMSVESILRLFHPVAIDFNEAIVVAVVGLAVNVVSAAILGSGHTHHHDHESNHDQHHHELHDHNHRSALVHVLADALTSVTAIIALLAAKYYGSTWMDPVMGIVGSLVILKWAYNLCRDSAWELLDGHSKSVSPNEIAKLLKNAGHKPLDIHIWKIGLGNHACQIIVESTGVSKLTEIRNLISEKTGNAHIVIEER
jgi:cation diffusion facilitator family transporter